MPDPFTILGAVSASIALAKTIIQTIDPIIGCCTQNTPVAALWLDLLSELRTEVIRAQSELSLAKDVVGQVRGSGASAANLKREEVGFDELIRDLALQLQASEDAITTATAVFKDQGVFSWALLEAAGTKARKTVAPIQSCCEDLKRIRCQVHDARERITNAFLLSRHDSTGSQFPTLESLGNIREELADKFLWPDPFCKTFKTEDIHASGLLLCNKTDRSLEELQKKIQEMGLHWVHKVRHDTGNRDAASNSDQRHASTIDALEACQDKVLVQLKGVFKAIITNRALFTTEDYSIAMRGQCTLAEWSSICVAAEGGIVIAIGGKMSAGKSSIINAMLGQSLLPTAQLVCTAVPSRLRHVSGQIEPTLSIPWIDPYVECLEWIKAQDLRNDYRHSPLPDRVKKWTAFEHQDPAGRDLLAKIRAKEYPILKTETKGGEAIDQMKVLNSLVRICRRFGYEVDMGYPNQWPMLSVEFTGLKYYCQNLPGPFTLLDLPGYNDDINKDTTRFRELMTRAARQADVMVPVIAGPTMVQGKQWAEHIIRSEWSTKISSVIITKRDLVKSLPLLRRHFSTIATKCELPGRDDCVLLCNTLEGMAAMQLQLLLDEIERKYATNPIPPAEIDERLQQETAIVIAGITDELNPFHRLYKKDSDPQQFATFTFNDWGELVETRLVSSQLRQTCDSFATNTIEEARKLRLARFIGEMEEILVGLVLSLSKTLGGERVSTDGNRASIDELHQIQFKTKKTMSDLQNVLDQWTPCIDEVAAQQEGKLLEVLLRFEQAAKDSANEAFESSVVSVRLDGGVYLLGRGRKAESIIKKCHETVLGRLALVVDDAIRELNALWKENQDALLSPLRKATANIATFPQLAELIRNTIDELENVSQLDPEKLRIAMSATPGEDAVDATSKKLRHRILIRIQRFLAQAPWKQKSSRSGGTKAIESQSATPTSVPVPPSSSPITCPDASVAVVNETTASESPDTNFAGLAVGMLMVNMAESLRAVVSELQGSVPTVRQTVGIAGDNHSDDGGVEDQRPLKLSQEVLRQRILEVSLDPLISRVKAGVHSSMTESLNEMGRLVQRAVLGALEEHDKVIERQLKARGSEGYKQLRSETLERLTCWGNLVGALGAIQEMREMWNEPVVRVTPSRPSSTLLVGSPRLSSPSLRSPSPSIMSGVSRGSVI